MRQFVLIVLTVLLPAVAMAGQGGLGDMIVNLDTEERSFQFAPYKGSPCPGHVTTLLTIRHLENDKKIRPVYVCGIGEKSDIRLRYPTDRKHIDRFRNDPAIRETTKFGLPEGEIKGKFHVFSGCTQPDIQVCAGWFRRPRDEWPELRFHIAKLTPLVFVEETTGGIRNDVIVEKYTSTATGKLMVDDLEIPLKLEARLTINEDPGRLKRWMIVQLEKFTLDAVKDLHLPQEDAGKLSVEIYCQGFAKMKGSEAAAEEQEKQILEAIGPDGVGPSEEELELDLDLDL